MQLRYRNKMKELKYLRVLFTSEGMMEQENDENLSFLRQVAGHSLRSRVRCSVIHKRL